MRTYLNLLTNTIFTICLCLMPVVLTAQAAILTVTKIEDTNDTACDSDCSLREAITAAAASGDTIQFASPLFDSPQTITLSETAGFQSLVIGKNLTITGKGANLLIVRRSPSAVEGFRIFEIGSDFIVNLSGMTISGGFSDFGAGIYNTGALTLSGVVISNNTANSLGAGIFSNVGATLNVTNSTISGNGGGNLNGGGIAGVGTINVTNSTISGNTAVFGGGIITFSSSPTTLTVTNSTVSNNSAQNSGGGIYDQSNAATLRNTIVANNTAATSPDLRNTFTSQGYNLIGNGSGATVTPTTGDQIGTSAAPIDPLLGPLQNNGGTTETRALLPGSPAIDKGNGSGATTDQRGFTRPIDLDDTTYPDVSDASDIGAFEAQTVPSGGFASFSVTKIADTGDGTCDGDCSLREAITAANVNAGADIITFDIAGAGPHTIQLTAALPELAQSVRILNSSGESITVSGEGAADPYRIFKINAGQAVQILNLTITNGNTAGEGGGINNGGTLTLSNSTVSNNISFGFGGGGIYNDVGSTLNIINSTISGNTATGNGNGGGIAGVGIINITNSTISGNTAVFGGGIITFSDTALTITSSTVSSNSAQNFGGGILHQSNAAILRNTIIADNIASTRPDLSGTFNSEGYNLIEEVAGATINETQNSGTNVIGQDPNLGSLQNYGGSTQTQILLPGSPAIDKGKSFGLTADQRGLTRPIDNASIPNAAGGDGADIGAFEFQTNENQPPVANPDSYSTGRNIPLTVNAPGVLSNDTDANNNPLTAVKVSDPSHGTLTLNSNGSFTYTPALNYVGSDSFSYKASDGSTNSNVATVTLTVNAAGTLTVTKTADTRDGACDADCSLREAIADAQSGDTITFSSLFNSAQAITLLGSSTPGGFQDLVINKNLTINGKGANLLTIRRNSANIFRIFNVNGSGVTVNLNNLTVSDGNSTGFNGGGINANGGVTLNVTGCRISGNTAGNGGGIYVAGDSTLNLTNSTVSGNTAGGNGSSSGGIHNEGILTITNSTVSGNVKNNGSNNGGGIWTNNTTIITNSTIADNQSAGSGSASGVYRSGNVAAVTIRNTIIAANRNNSTLPDAAGAFTSNGYNFIGNVGTATGFSQTGDSAGTSSSVLDPKLAPLDFYGGRTQTHALHSNSPAVNVADPNNTLTADQRGVARPIGGRADIGAFEVNFTFSNSPAGVGGQGTLPSGSTGQSYSVTFSANQLTGFSEFDSNDSDSLEQSGEANLGVAYSYTIIAGSLPNGLTLNSNTGELSGTPTQTGTFNFTLKVIDFNSGTSGTQAYVLNVFAPTASTVSVGGRVLAPDRNGLRNALVTLTAMNGEARTILTGKFGSFRFGDVAAGETYIISVASRRYVFQAQVIVVAEDLDNLIFTAVGQTGNTILQP